MSSINNFGSNVNIFDQSLNRYSGSALVDTQEYALELVGQKIQQFVSSSYFTENMNLVFGHDWNHQAMQSLIQDWKQHDFKNFGHIDILTGMQLNGANAVFSAETDSIYVSADFLKQNTDNINAVVDVLLEEIGHRIDVKINIVDATGDEGDILQRIVQGKPISASELANLKNENDFASLVIHGKTLLVEQNISNVPDYDENKAISIQDKSGKLRIFAIGKDNNVWQWRESDNNITWWHKMGLQANEIEVIQDRNGSLRVFGVATDNNVWQWRESDNNMTWWHKMGLSGKDLEVTRDKNGFVRAFGIGTDNNVWQWRESDNNMTWWHKMGLLANEIEVTQDKNGFARVFGVATDSSVVQWREFDNNMTWWHKMGLLGQGEVELAKDKSGNLRVFAVGTDSNVWQWRESDNNITWWHKMGLLSKGSLEAIQDKNGSLRVFGVGTDSNVWQWREFDNNMTWWHKMGLSSNGEIEGAKDQGGNLRVVSVGTDNNVWQWRESDNNMTWWHKMGFLGHDVTAIQGNDGSVRVLGMATDSNLWQWRESDNNLTWWHKMGLLVQDSMSMPNVSKELRSTSIKVASQKDSNFISSTSGWEIKGSGDFNGDGKSDILWRNVNGQNHIWLMNGTQIISQGDTNFVAANSGWEIKGVGDINGDGKADIIWHNSNGQVHAWLMNGLKVTSQGDIGNVGRTGWEIKGVGDLNGDGKADIIWHNHNGQVHAWLMNGLKVTSQGDIGNVGRTGWEIKGVGDLNGDKKADIFWHNSNGQTHAWQMNGLTVTGQGDLHNIGNTGWQTQAIGDFNGDGASDVFWRHQGGQTHIWFMQSPPPVAGVTSKPNYYPSLSSLSDDEWDRYTGDNTRFDGVHWGGEKDERHLTPDSIKQIYTDLSTAVLGTRYKMTAGYLYDQSYYNGLKKWHSGIDFLAPAGTQVKTVSGGTVAWTWYEASAGAFIAIKGSDGKQWVYGHLQNIGNFSQGQTISKGQVIGQIGNQSGAKHLHLEVRTSGQGGGNPDQNFVRNNTMSPLQAFWQLQSGSSSASNSTGGSGYSTIPAVIPPISGSPTVIAPGKITSTLNFALNNQSIWNGGQGQSWGGAISGKVGEKGNFGLGELEVEAGYSLEAFLSGGTFNVDFPALFDISWKPNVVGNSVAVNFSARPTSIPKLETILGLSFKAEASASADLSANLWGFTGSVGLDFSAGLDSGSILSNIGAPVSLDFGLSAKSKNQFETGTQKLKAEDVAFQAIDIPNTLALIPHTRLAGKGMKDAGIGLKLGANIKQESFFDIKGFEIDYDGKKNGNELIIGLNGSGTLNIPLLNEFKVGREFKFTPTVRPIVEFQTQFSVAGKLEGSFDVLKIGKSILDKLPEPLRKPVENALPTLTFKETRLTPYTDPWRGSVFNPYANISAKLADISVRIG